MSESCLFDRLEARKKIKEFFGNTNQDSRLFLISDDKKQTDDLIEWIKTNFQPTVSQVNNYFATKKSLEERLHDKLLSAFPASELELYSSGRVEATKPNYQPESEKTELSAIKDMAIKQENTKHKDVADSSTKLLGASDGLAIKFRKDIEKAESKKLVLSIHIEPSIDWFYTKKIYALIDKFLPTPSLKEGGHKVVIIVQNGPKEQISEKPFSLLKLTQNDVRNYLTQTNFDETQMNNFCTQIGNKQLSYKETIRKFQNSFGFQECPEIRED